MAPSQGAFRWDEAERIFAFAGDHGFSVHGHTLFWFKQPLDWAVRASAGHDLAGTVALFGDVVEAVLRRFPGALSRDVVNEVAVTDSFLRPGAPVDRYRLDVIERMLHRARAAAPGAAALTGYSAATFGQSVAGAAGATGDRASAPAGVRASR